MSVPIVRRTLVRVLWVWPPRERGSAHHPARALCSPAILAMCMERMACVASLTSRHGVDPGHDDHDHEQDQEERQQDLSDARDGYS